MQSEALSGNRLDLLAQYFRFQEVGGLLLRLSLSFSFGFLSGGKIARLGCIYVHFIYPTSFLYVEIKAD